MARPIDELVNILGFEYDPKGLEMFKKGAKQAGKAMVALSAAFVASVAGAAKLALDTAASGDEYAKLGRQIGLTAEEIQEFEFVADRQGVAAGELRGAFGFLNKGMSDLSRGAGAMKSMLKDSNPELLKQLETAKGTGDAFSIAMAAINKAPDTIAKTTIAMAIFGKSGAKMLRIAEAGAGGIAGLRQEVRDLGGVMSNETAAASEILIDQWANLQWAIKGLKNLIGAELIPYFTEVGKKLVIWTKMNKDLIRSKVIEYVKKYIAILKEVFDVIKKGMKIFTGFTDILGGTSNAIKILTTALVFIMALKIVPFIKSMVLWMKVMGLTALKTAGAMNLMLLGLPVIIALVVTAIAVLIMNWEKVSWYLDYFIVTLQVAWEAFKEFAVGLWSGITDFIMGLWDKVVKHFKNKLEDIKTGFLFVFGALFKKLKQFLNLLGGVKDKIKGAAGAVGRFFGFGTDEKKKTGAMQGASDLIQPSQIRENSVLGANGAGMSTTNNNKKMNVNQDIKFTISGAENPQAVAAEVNQMLREASAGATNNSTTGTF